MTFTRQDLLIKPRILPALIASLLLTSAPFVVFAEDNETAKEGKDRTTALEQDQSSDEESTTLEEVTVTGTQIKGAAISEALAVSVIDAGEIEAMGISSGDELFDQIPEMGQNFFSEGESHGGGVNSVNGDVGAFNLRNMGTGNTLTLLNGRRMVNMAGYQTEVVGGSFVPVNSANSNSIPVYGIERVEVLRDGASAIYGADAVAGVVNEVLKSDFEGFTIRARIDDYDNIPRNDERINIEWGKFFNQGRTNVGLFLDFYSRDPVNSQDDPKWADSNYSRFVDPEWVAEFGTNYSSNSQFPQIDFRSGSVGRSVRDLGFADSSGEIQVFPAGDARCTFVINENTCGAPDTPNVIYDLNENRDLLSELDRYNLFLHINHELENGVESFTELAWYEADSRMRRHPSLLSTGETDLQIGPEYYFNPFGPCGSPNRLPDEIIGDANLPCAGSRLEIDFHRPLESPRFSNTKSTSYRILQGFRGTKGNWDWETALVLSEAERDNVTSGRLSNTILQDLLNSSSPNTYNIFAGEGGDLEGLRPAIVDVSRLDKSELQMFDIKFSNPELFDLSAGPVGFLTGFEFRRESFLDDRDPRLDGTIAYTAFEGATFPIVSDIANSSPTSDNSGDRNVLSTFAEFALPITDNLDVQAALRYEDFSDVGSTTVGKLAFGWRATDSLLVRGSYSTAFRAPNLITINEDLVVRQNTRVDAVCDYVEAVTGANLDQDCTPSTQRRATGSADLVAEESENTSLGIVWDATDNLTLTLDYWTIEKDDSIGLFGENNHMLYDLLLRLRAGTGNCDGAVFNPAVGRDAPEEDDIEHYLAAGICPAGDNDFVEDQYTNLDTRTIEGYDIGVYYDMETNAGDFNFKFNATYYDKYEQVGSQGIALLVQEAIDSGELPGFQLSGYGDLLQREGNYEEKFNASVRWRKGDWGAYVQALKVGSFYDADRFIEQGGTTVNWWMPSMTTYNASFDYDFDAFGADTRIRLGINNLTDERAPICDCRFGFWADAHRDYGRYWYLDWRLKFD